LAIFGFGAADDPPADNYHARVAKGLQIVERDFLRNEKISAPVGRDGIGRFARAAKLCVSLGGGIEGKSVDPC